MPLFSILLISPSEEVRKDLSKNILDHYKEEALKVNETSYIVSTKETVARNIAEAVGIYNTPQREDTLGLVFRLNGSYAGYGPGTIWDWIENQTKKVS